MNGGVIAGIAGGVLAMAPIFWGAFQIYDDITERLEVVEENQQELRTAGDPELGERIMRELTSLEQRLAEAERAAASARIQAGQAVSEAGGGGQALLDRVNNLSTRIAALEASPVPENTDRSSIDSLVDRIETIEQRLQALGRAGATNTYGAAPHPDAFPFIQVNAPKEYGPFTVELAGCEIRGSSVECYGSVAYEGSERTVCVDEAYLKTTGGAAFRTGRVVLGGTDSRNRACRSMTIQQYPFQIRFDEVPLERQYTLEFQVGDEYTINAIGVET
jgi:hypothetical protein